MEEIYECQGCRFDINCEIKNKEELVTMINTCEKCKRAMLPEYQQDYKDLYIRR